MANPQKMYYVYNLFFLKDREFYTGSTNNLKRRVSEHKQCKVTSTKKRGFFKLIHYEAFTDKHDATRRETYFKSTKGKRTLRLMLKYGLKKVKIHTGAFV